MPVNLSGLPQPVLVALQTIKEQVATMRRPFPQLVTAFNPATLQAEEIEQQVIPHVDVLIEMPEVETVRIYAHRTKPYSEPVLLKSFNAEHYTALRTKVEEEAVSWEEYFERMMADG